MWNRRITASHIQCLLGQNFLLNKKIVKAELYLFNALNKIDGLDLHLDSFSKNVVSVIPHSSEFSPELTFIFYDSSEITYFVTRKLICHGNTSNIHYYLVDEDYKKTIDTELSPIQKHIMELINKLYIWFLAKKHLLS